MRKIKTIIKNIVLSNKVTAKHYFKKQYSNDISDDLLFSKIKQIAHRYDHKFLNSMLVNKEDIYEMEYLLEIAIDRNLKFDDSLLWALSLHKMAQLDAVNSYMFKKKETDKNSYESEISKIIKERRSVRKWNENKVKVELIKEIIKTSLWAPSSCNRQPVRVIILDEEQKKFIKKYFSGTFWHDAPVQVLIMCNSSAYSKTDELFPYLDGGAFIQNMLLLLHEAGLGSCWLGFKKWNIKNEIFCETNEYDEFYNYFRLEKELVPISMVVAGNYEVIPNAPARQSLNTVIIGGGK
ncbi:MAG TPA: nitroreductase family protein [Clostridia bacterium]|nr:nitroreductase family protein [Clostridia bacterium]